MISIEDYLSDPNYDPTKIFKKYINILRRANKHDVIGFNTGHLFSYNMFKMLGLDMNTTWDYTGA